MQFEDLSARPHIVRQEQNPAYYNIIKELYIGKSVLLGKKDELLKDKRNTLHELGVEIDSLKRRRAKIRARLLNVSQPLSQLHISTSGISDIQRRVNKLQKFKMDKLWKLYVKSVGKDVAIASVKSELSEEYKLLHD